MNDRLGMQPGGARAEHFDDFSAKPCAAAGRRDDERARQAEPLRFVADPRHGAGGKYHALRGNIVDEGRGHAHIVSSGASRRRAPGNPGQH